MANWMNLGEMVKIHAGKNPDKIALKEATRELTFSELNERVNRIANGLAGLGMKKGDKFAVLLENSIEIVELYLAAAKWGFIIVPINFRLAPKDIEYIVNDSDATTLFVHHSFLDGALSVKDNIPNIGKRFFVVGEEKEGFSDYENFVSQGDAAEPDTDVKPEDIWVLLYTSGTTGIPKGVLRSHESYVAFYLINAVDFGFTEDDICMTIMPLCHVNSTFFSFTFTYIGATIYIHPAMGFDAFEVLKIVEKEKITFISLIPTHYNLILSVPEEEREKLNLTSLKKLLCSSAPAVKETKSSIMECFPGVELYEGYGSTEAGIVTILKPYEQMTKPGSIGRESVGTDFVKILSEDGKECNVGEIGELYSRGPMMFSGYHKLPEKTQASFRGEYFSAGDLAKKDEDVYFYLVDRKANMIITGGEHVFPSEVEVVIGQNKNVLESAVVGLPHSKWGEEVTAFVVLKEGKEAGEEELIAFCKDRLPSFKCPKKVRFLKFEDMPHTGSGKVLHRVLRERFSKKVN